MVDLLDVIAVHRVDVLPVEMLCRWVQVDSTDHVAAVPVDVEAVHEELDVFSIVEAFLLLDFSSFMIL